MLDTATLEHTDHSLQRMQWRGSHDGITWSRWFELTNVDAMVDAYDQHGPFDYCQGRVQVDGRWVISPVSTWEP